MKTIVFFIAMAISVSGVVAGDISSQNVPSAVENSFHKKFPDITKNVSWNLTADGRYEADFSFAHEHVAALFEANGHLVEMDVQCEWFDMPYKARQYIYTNYTGCTIDKYEIIEHPHKENLYGIHVHKNNHSYSFIFNKRGDLIKMRAI